MLITLINIFCVLFAEPERMAIVGFAAAAILFQFHAFARLRSRAGGAGHHSGAEPTHKGENA